MMLNGSVSHSWCQNRQPSGDKRSSSSSSSTTSSSSRRDAWPLRSRLPAYPQTAPSNRCLPFTALAASSHVAAARRQQATVVCAGKRAQGEVTPHKQPPEEQREQWDDNQEQAEHGDQAAKMLQERGLVSFEWQEADLLDAQNGVAPSFYNQLITQGGTADEDGTDEDEEDEDECADDEEGDEKQPVSRVVQIPAGQQTVAFAPGSFVEVGVISRAHGIRGEVKVQLVTDEPKKRLGTSGRRLWLQGGAGRGSTAAGGSSAMLQRVVVQSGRVARPASRERRAEWAVKFKEVPSRDEAELLAGAKLLLALCDRESSPSGRDEFFITDLVGLQARQQGSQQLLGIVTEVYDSTGSYSLLRVRLAPDESDIQQSRYRSILVPFVEGMVPTVDVAAGQLLLSLPEGLLETASSRKLRRPYTAEQQAQLRQQLLQRQQQQEQQQEHE